MTFLPFLLNRSRLPICSYNFFLFWPVPLKSVKKKKKKKKKYLCMFIYKKNQLKKKSINACILINKISLKKKKKNINACILMKKISKKKKKILYIYIYN